MRLPTELYKSQAERWPQTGRHILAHYDDHSIIVYQAYRPSIGQFAVHHGYLGGPDFSLSRMSWIKPNFLWMMYRSGWATKPGQEMVVGFRLARDFFDQLLTQAVPSTYEERQFPTRPGWQDALQRSDVRLQWDPDHAPTGARLDRRAIQLGLRGKTLERFARTEILEVIDMTDFVIEQRANAMGSDSSRLWTPIERVYLPLMHLSRD